jgi:hypothetical protein
MTVSDLLEQPCNLLTTCDKQCEHNLLTACWQTCYKMWDFYVRMWNPYFTCETRQNKSRQTLFSRWGAGGEQELTFFLITTAIVWFCFRSENSGSFRREKRYVQSWSSTPWSEQNILKINKFMLYRTVTYIYTTICSSNSCFCDSISGLERQNKIVPRSRSLYLWVYIYPFTFLV